MGKKFRAEGAEERIKKVAIWSLGIAILFFAYMVYLSKATSYLSKDPKACINCHVMNTQYATWQHSSHARDVTCVQCHLPTDGFISKYIAKSRDGFNHTIAFTFDTYDHAIKISEDGAKRVQRNCITCHKSLASTMASNANKYHSFDDENVENGRRCWSCHRDVPHGRVRALTTTPNSLDTKTVN
ncbi:cytochrome c nitrite reductase small subunit [Sulfurimonas sp. MAG313]|nr:cytochrome c nitrite reductase small subunit [Sulfurimonas sp. MAG313]MDF1880593.1 cytochrome c nitrite reductase small subunit [Sulfurimonas sp. MAG313]